MRSVHAKGRTLDFESVIAEIQSNFEYEQYHVERRYVGHEEAVLTMTPWSHSCGTPFELHVTYRDLLVRPTDGAGANFPHM